MPRLTNLHDCSSVTTQCQSTPFTMTCLQLCTVILDEDELFNSLCSVGWLHTTRHVVCFCCLWYHLSAEYSCENNIPMWNIICATETVNRVLNCMHNSLQKKTKETTTKPSWQAWILITFMGNFVTKIYIIWTIHKQGGPESKPPHFCQTVT